MATLRKASDRLTWRRSNVTRACRTGPRSVHWRSDQPATLVWAEAQDSGDPRQQADIRDKLFSLSAPFTGSPTELAALQMRFSEVDWGNDKLFLVTESWWKSRKTRTWRFGAGAPQTLGQCPPGQELEGHIGPPVALAVVVHLDDIRVLE